MKITFTFTDSPDLAALPKAEVYTTSLDIPDDAIHLIGCRERVLAVGELVGKFTQASIHLTCTPLQLKNYPIKLVAPTDNLAERLQFSSRSLFVVFSRGARRSLKRQLKIFTPGFQTIPRYMLQQRGKRARERNSLSHNLWRIDSSWAKSDSEREYQTNLKHLIDQVLVLLNAEPMQHPNLVWTCSGFHPYWVDNTIIDRHNKQVKEHRAAERRKQKDAEKQAARVEKLRAQGKEPVAQTELPAHGAGRRPGARPGIFKGVQMRSQLEIRFAAQLEEKGLRWVYESETLGSGGYLVDFHLPDLNVWVEVKGRFEARDHYLLKEVAQLLKTERHERLLVYGQSRAWVVNPSGFREIAHDEFWKLINR